MDLTQKPHAIGIGFGRAGTSFVSEVLSQHPEFVFQILKSRIISHRKNTTWASIITTKHTFRTIMIRNTAYGWNGQSATSSVMVSGTELEKGSVFRAWCLTPFSDIGSNDFVEFDSMINIRPSQNNRSRGVDDSAIREKIMTIVNKWVKR